MTRIKLILTGAHAWASVEGPLTSGMVGTPVTIEYDDAWDGLTKNLMCRCSPWNSNDGEIRTILNVGETSTVAHEVMQAGMYLHLGVEGFSSDGTLVIPTTWARCGKIEYGANTCEDLSTDPDLPIWNQLQTEMEQTKKYVLTPEQATNIQAYAQTATQAAQEAQQAAEEAKQTAENGLYYMPTVSQPTDTTLKFEFKPSITGVPIPKPVTVELPVGSGDSGGQVVIDTTLTQSGAAADAAVVGAKFSATDAEIKRLSDIVAALQAGMTVVYGNMVVSSATIDMDEGATATFTVCLDAAPTIDQSVQIAVSNSYITVAPAALTFTADNYSTPQTITVTAAEDSETVNRSSTITLTSAVNTVEIVATIVDNDLSIEWHVITVDEVTGINATTYLLATYTGTAENIMIPATLNDKQTVMNTSANAPFDANGILKNIKIEDGVGGTFACNPSETVYGLGDITKFTAGAQVKKIVIDAENASCTLFRCANATALTEIRGLEHLTGLTSCEQMFTATAITEIDAYPPNMSNAKLMFWKCANLTKAPDITMELTEWANMFLQCTSLSEVTVSAMKGCDMNLIGGSSPSGENFTFRCNYGSDMYLSFRDMICNSASSKENLFCELLDASPVKDIVMWGDSMTRAGNTTMGNVPDQLAGMVSDDVMVWNYGISGNTIQTCATRFNNHPEKWSNTSVIWLGTNNTTLSGAEMTALIQSEFIDKLTTDEYIVIGLLTTNYSDEKNEAFASAFGNHFLDIRSYFMEHMWEISGLTATEQDETDIADGLIPTSFRVDVTHLNPTGGLIVATAIREKLLSMGYVTDEQILTE